MGIILDILRLKWYIYNGMLYKKLGKAKLHICGLQKLGKIID